MIDRVKRVAVDNRSFILFILLMSVFRSSLADWNSVPTGSMKPTIVEGDRIIINKLAYDLRIPFLGISMAKLSDPERGDIIIFNSKVSKKRLVKRVIGIPGDIVSMTNNVVSLNGKALEYKEQQNKGEQGSRLTSIDLTEKSFGLEHSIRVSRYQTKASSFAPTIVPKGMYLALGDNRDNSADSRFIGFIPRDEIIGRSRNVAMSVDYQDHYFLRKERFFKTL